MTTLTTEQYDWGFASGRVSALEGRLLSREFLNSLLAARAEEIPRLVQETPVGAHMTPGAAWDDLGEPIDRHFRAVAMSLRGDSPAPMPVDLFLLKDKYAALKRALLDPNAEAPEGVAARLTGADDRLRVLDAALDGAYLEEYLALAVSLDTPLLREYAECYVLSRAVVTLWRALRMQQPLRDLRERFLPLEPFTNRLDELMAAGDVAVWPGLVGGDLGGCLASALEEPEDQRVPRFERLAAERLARIAALGRYQSFGPERVFAYLAALADEAYNLKVAACGRMNRIDPALLRSRLREVYG